jgi:hypothetical protein
VAFCRSCQQYRACARICGASGIHHYSEVKSLELTDTARQQVFGIRVAFFRGPDGEEIELFEDRLGHT